MPSGNAQGLLRMPQSHSISVTVLLGLAEMETAEAAATPGIVIPKEALHYRK